MWPGSPGSSGPANSLGKISAQRMVGEPAPANKKAAGEPAANSTGRHHNVREDIGLGRWSAPRDERGLTSQPSLDGLSTRPVNTALTARTFRTGALNERVLKGYHRRWEVRDSSRILWWARLGLNQRPLRCQRSALPLSYAPHASYLNPTRRHFNLVAASPLSRQRRQG